MESLATAVRHPQAGGKVKIKFGHIFSAACKDNRWVNDRKIPGSGVRNSNALKRWCSCLEGGLWNSLRERDNSVQGSDNAELWQGLVTTNSAIVGPRPGHDWQPPNVSKE